MSGLVVSVLATLIALVAAWLLLVAVLWLHRPSRERAGLVLGLIPDVARLAYRLARDPETPTRYRLGLSALSVYLAIPIDLIPDVIPVIGSLDDVILATIVLRWVGRGVGREQLARHWAGSTERLAALEGLLGLG